MPSCWRCARIEMWDFVRKIAVGCEESNVKLSEFDNCYRVWQKINEGENMRVMICTSAELFSEALCQSIERWVSAAVCTSSSQGNIKKMIDTHKPDVLILEPAANPCRTVLLDLHKHYPEMKLLLLLPDATPDELKAVYVMEGVAGYIKKECAHEKLCTALQAIHDGQIWVERHVIAMALCSFVTMRIFHGWPNQQKTKLTKKETEIIHLVSLGLSNKEMANKLNVSEGTIKSHLYNIFRKLGVKSRLKALGQYSVVANRD